MLHEAGFGDVVIGDPVDTFARAGGEPNARAYDVYGYAFKAGRASPVDRGRHGHP
ncbi:MAG: hypothetical protein H0U21_06770 [Acidimicrobiia bacterium]|nr:hypothetical protein [Acidimicrobiia bacterium]